MMQPADPVLSPSQACEEVVEKWKAVCYPHLDFSRETHAVSGRVASWLSPVSVMAGVKDVFAASRDQGKPLAPAAIADLAEQLARRLSTEGMLATAARRQAQPAA